MTQTKRAPESCPDELIKLIDETVAEVKRRPRTPKEQTPDSDPSAEAG